MNKSNERLLNLSAKLLRGVIQREKRWPPDSPGLYSQPIRPGTTSRNQADKRPKEE